MLKYSHFDRQSRATSTLPRKAYVSTRSRSCQPNHLKVKPTVSISLHNFMEAQRQKARLNSSCHTSTYGLDDRYYMPLMQQMMTSSAYAGAVCNGKREKSPADISRLENSSSMSSLVTSSSNGTDKLQLFEQSNMICGSDGEILSGSLDALLHKLFPRAEYCPPRQFIFTMLLNLRAFIAPADLLQKLLQHCLFEQHSNTTNFRRESRFRFFENVFVFCDEWTTTIPYDFRDAIIRDRLLELLGLCSVDATTKRRADELMYSLRSSLSRLERYENALRCLRRNIEDPPSQSDQLTGLITVCADPLTVAEQLAHIELERLSMVGPDEFYQAFSNSDIENIGQSLDSLRTSNIRHYIDWFNQLTALVATEILRNARKRFRAKTIEFFIDVAKECINVGNFNSLMAIVAGLSLQPIARLKRTWARVEKSKLEVLQHQLDPSGNFISYRATLKAAIWRYEGAKNDTEKVIIPFFGLLVKDLFLIYTRCVAPLPNGHLNVTMFAQFADHIVNVVKWKTRPCPFKRNPQVLQYLLLGAIYPEKDLQRVSYTYELPDNAVDREEFKKLTDAGTK